ncbi:triacylglycerol lipase OBL1-like [Rhododendron vialii]|uniref:triacylglycerol lipase OBL1-like n=1 Tax=Rhododendron vialii TaxID=182163 RepID=UPI00266000D8|nr:triacylglycerol lipase OBL1-like [Rhododendron vialii]
MARRELVDSCNGYLELKPHHASLLDLVRVLFSSHKSLSTKKFVETSDANHLKGLELRWIVFISLLVQKLLLYLTKPVARTGYVIEMGLNLLSSNGGFCRLLLNTLKGSVVKLDKSSAKFVSVLGYVDTRVELDKNIKTADDRYGAALSIMASKLAYEYQPFAQSVVTDHWKMEMLGWFNFWNDYQNLYSTKAFMFKDTTSNPNLIVVAFRGTEPFDLDQWRTDVDFSWYELHGVGRIHSGFLKALGVQKKSGWPKDIIDEGLDQQYAYYTLRQKLKEELEKDKNVKFILTGHSLGAALAILFLAGLVLHEEEELLESLDWVYTYGQPRVGNEQFGNWMGEKMRIHDVKYLRYVYSADLVPRVPYDDQAGTLYKHFGPCLWVNSFYRGKVVWEEPDKNYFSLLWAIPKILNAVWELIRGFILPYIYGPVYQESCVMKLVRVFGMFIPGLAAHCPQDYDNATRLGSFPPEILDQQVLNGKRD